jgi:hypothetical protein
MICGDIADHFRTLYPVQTRVELRINDVEKTRKQGFYTERSGRKGPTEIEGNWFTT